MLVSQGRPRTRRSVIHGKCEAEGRNISSTAFFLRLAIFHSRASVPAMQSLRRGKRAQYLGPHVEFATFRIGKPVGAIAIGEPFDHGGIASQRTRFPLREFAPRAARLDAVA